MGGAGPVGVGAAAAAESGGAKIIWVDSDGFLTTDYGSIILTSVMKQIGPAVFDTVSESADGNFTSEPYVGTLENEGVGLAPFHDFEDAVPAELQDQIAQYQEQIIAGDLVVESPNAPCRAAPPPRRPAPPGRAAPGPAPGPPS